MDPVSQDELMEVYAEEEKPDGTLANRGRTRVGHLVVTDQETSSAS